ncbi:VOC family protein [Acidisoma cladoniae]|jgi:catechol 2,3-dioxygenase-like lactoylglutathione lyase family enzyme|uniref:VOC family protein n=1 Tax=Acidisoma cladoniae TaxID=3040935 RepID=UPI00254EB517|nr:VOC family protein [Acidisoma sp. PAMC 29798]
MDFAQLHVISDICLLVEDLDRSIAFYTDKLGFTVLRRAEGFAAFNSQGVSLVVWQASHVPDVPRPITHSMSRTDHRACVSIRLPSVADVDRWYENLVGREVSFQRLPANYPWGARCCYFTDPDNILWELYADIGEAAA